MRFDLKKPLTSYTGQLFTRPVVVDGQPVIEEGRPKIEPMTLQGALEAACLNADPNQHNDGAKKMLIFNLLMKIHSANPWVDLSAEEISILKDLTGKQLNVAAVGAIYLALDRPVAENAAKE